MAGRQNKDVFINCPFDTEYVPHLIALVSTLTMIGLVPRSVLEIASSRHRLERLVTLIKKCRYSIHDLSRVELSGGPPGDPRFNMPFELGLAVTTSYLPKKHDFFVLESERHRLTRTLSDLGGYDPYIHKGNPVEVISCVRDMFVSSNYHFEDEDFNFANEALSTFCEEKLSNNPLRSNHFVKLVAAGFYISKQIQQKKEA